LALQCVPLHALIRYSSRLDVPFYLPYETNRFVMRNQDLHLTVLDNQFPR
jgi:hypothetical protein